MKLNLLKRNPDIHMNVYPNWQRGNLRNGYNFMVYSKMFKDCADSSLNSFQGNERYELDDVIIPILFLYRHSIELILKSIILTSCLERNMKKDDIIRKIKNKHFLDYLWDEAKPFIENYINESGNDIEPLNYMEEIVKTFQELDNKSFVFRYPYDNKIKEELIFQEGNKSDGFDYKHFYQIFSKGYGYLHGTAADIYSRYESKDTISVIGH